MWDYTTLTKTFEKPTGNFDPRTWIITEDGIGYLLEGNSNNTNPKKLTLNAATSTYRAYMDIDSILVQIDINGPFQGPNKRCGVDDLGIANKDDIKNLSKCDQIWIFLTTEGFGAGNPDTMIAAKILEDKK